MAKNKAGSSSKSSYLVVFALLVVGAFVYFYSNDFIKGSEAGVSVMMTIATNGNDSTGDGSERKPYRTIGKAVSRIQELNAESGVITVSGTTYSVKENGPINIGPNSRIVLASRPGEVSGLTNPDGGNYTRFNVEGILDVYGFKFVNDTSFYLNGVGARAKINVHNNYFEDRSLSFGTSLHASDGARVVATNNQINVSWGTSFPQTNYGINLYAKSGGTITFQGNRVNLVRNVTPPAEDWMAGVLVATSLPSFKGHKYVIRDNEFTTITKFGDKKQSQREWGISVSSNGDLLEGVEDLNTFTSFLGIPVNREKTD